MGTTAEGRGNVYSNSFSKELLPGMIKPLVWSINIPLVNGAWVRFLSALTGVQGLKPAELAKQFYYRAYFNMGALGLVWERMGLPQDSLERLTGVGGEREKGIGFAPTPKMLVITPNLINFLLRHFAIADRLEELLPRKEEELKELAQENFGKLSEDELLQRVDALTKGLEETVYYNVITPLVSSMLKRLLDSRLRRAGVDPSEVDMLKGLAGIHRYYPNDGLRSLHKAFSSLGERTRARLRKEGSVAILDMPRDDAFRQAFQRFIQDFGHVSESGNDFSMRPWREDPDLVLAMAMDFPEVGAEDMKKGVEELRLPLLRKGSVRDIHRKAKRIALLKERTSAAYTFGYGLYRNYFMELGRRFVSKELLAAPEDIFYLSLDEVRQIVSGGCAGNTCNNYRLRVMMRKREMAEMRDIDPPSVIHGEVAPPLKASTQSELRGTPTSRGFYKGRARVVRSPSEFSRVQSGDVLVIPYSDVAWTPLFAKAGAVVAEAGGMLSHTSIIAREYGIPAVVSVEGATRIPDGAEVSVDGSSGVVAIIADGAKD